MRTVQLMSRPMYAAPSGRTRSTRSDAWAEDLWNSHGQSVYSLALALLGDETRAMQAVALGMVDFNRRDISTTSEDTGRTLARLVYLRSTELASEISSSTELAPVMGCLAKLAQLQRATLALCTFGRHTYGDAAKVLGIAPLTVAQLLTSGLNELSRLSRTGDLRDYSPSTSR